ncbi:MAG: sulfite exporter TauE/SafE family protein [Anaerolineales bacterium]|nr:sulfite exporter TauE/SafE family protein [Anaerolineales bacterium]
MELTHIAASIIVFGAFLINAIGGFGAGIAAMPLLILFLDLRLASVAFAMATLLGLLQLGWVNRRELDLGPALPIMGGNIVGMFVGVSLLALPAWDIWAKGLLTAVILFTAVKELALPNKAKPNPQKEANLKLTAALGLGLVSGVLGGWINMGGPPLILYAYRSFDGRKARCFLIAIFILTLIVKLIAFCFKRLYTPEALILFATMAPAVLLGTQLGHALQKKIGQEIFIKVAWSILLALGVVLGVNTILSIA